MSRHANAGVQVWDRLWKHENDEDRERRQLAAERHSPRWQRLCQAILDRFDRVAGLRVVELGSGRGDLSTLLAQCGAQVTLVDLSDAALRQAKERFARLGLQGEFVKADMLELPESLLNRFDVSVSLGVIEHFRGEDRTRVMEAHQQVLNPGGLTMIGVPNAACLPYRLWKVYLQMRGWWPYGMEIPYSRRELRRRAEKSGFEVDDVYAYGWWQSVADHWCRGVFHRACEWGSRTSRLDKRMGLNLVLTARRRG